VCASAHAPKGEQMIDTQVRDSLSMKGWKEPSRKLKLTTRDFVYYFGFIYYQRTNTLYPIKQINWYHLGNQFTRLIADEFHLRNFSVKEMKELIEWVFENKKPEHWDLDRLEYFVEDWLKQKSIKTRLIKIREVDNVRSRRLEAKQFVKMFGEGYYDNQLTKEQYWIGLEWRKKHLSMERQFDLMEWQKKEFTPIENNILRGWRDELKREKLHPEKLQKLFYIEFAKSKGQIVLEILHEMRLEKLYKLYSREELEKKWHEEITA
jgi:hypothetical protein